MRGNRLTLAIVALIAVLVVLFIVFRDDLGKRALPPQANAPAAPAPSAQPSRPSTPPPGAAPAAPVENVAPSFDVVRVSRACTAVMAGRAAPGALVTVKSDDQELGRVTADARGEWAMVPDLPLKSGTRQITLNARIGNGPALEGNGAVVVVVPTCDPSQPQSGDQTIAVLTPRQGASQLLQVPQAPSGARGLSLNTVDYDEKGNLTMTGRAQPNTTVQVYVNNQPVGAPTADAQGKWTLKVDEKVPPGLYTLRVDQVEDTGKVISRLELPFARASAADIELRGNAVVVQPGNSLWRIARAAYGSGVQYTDIYTANREQIRDPDLIYPGQIFTLPEGQSRPN